MENAEQLDQKPVEQSQDQQGDQTPREPIYQVDQQSGHYGACFKLVQEKRGANPDVYQTIWTNIHNGLNDPYRGVLSTYWMAALRDIEVGEHNYKEHQLPLARIKKVMKADPEVKMISAEAPILFAKGCDIFITELTMRAWIHAEENKRRTLQRSDIAAALTKSDMFDFLIDIVPREEATASSTKRSTSQAQAAAAASQPPPSMPSQQAQPMAPPQPQHHPSQSYEQDPYHQQPEQDPYRQQSMYASHPAYAHYPPPQMAVDPSGMYTNYGMPPQQMYLQQLPPQPRQDHAGPPQNYHYSQHDARQSGNDADGEPEDP